MPRAAVLALALLALPAFVPAPLPPPLPALGPARAAEVEDPSVLPVGPGQEVTFYGCVACHNTAVIRRSRPTRGQWDGLMDRMVERHGMNPLEADERRVIVDYLAQHFGPAPAPRARNPFPH